MHFPLWKWETDTFIQTRLMPLFLIGVLPTEAEFIHMYSGILVPEYGQEKIYGVLDHLELVDSHKVPWSHNLPLTEHGEVMLPPGTGAVCLDSHLISTSLLVNFSLYHVTCRCPRAETQRYVNAINSLRAYVRKFVSSMVRSCTCNAADTVVKLRLDFMPPFLSFRGWAHMMRVQVVLC